MIRCLASSTYSGLSSIPINERLWRSATTPVVPAAAEGVEDYAAWLNWAITHIRYSYKPPGLSPLIDQRLRWWPRSAAVGPDVVLEGYARIPLHIGPGGATSETGLHIDAESIA